MEQRVAVDVGKALPRDHRLQRRRLKIGDEPLVDGVVGDAREPDMAVAPRLRRGPFDGIVEIDRLGERPRLALARRLARAAAVDAHRGVTARHPPFGRDGLPVHVRRGFFLQVRRRHPELVLLVRTEIEDRREFAAVVRPEHVRFQFRAVAHRHVDVFFDLELVGGGAGLHFDVHGNVRASWRWRNIVMAGHSRPKDGVASLAYGPGDPRLVSHNDARKAWMPGTRPGMTGEGRRHPHSGFSTFTVSARCFQCASSWSLHALASAMDAFGTGLIICFLNASCTGAELSAATVAL